MDQKRSLYVRPIAIVVFILFVQSLFSQQDRQAIIRGSVKDSKGTPVEFATVYIKETQQGTQSDIKGNFLLQVAPGSYTFCVQMMGYETYEQTVTLRTGESVTIPVTLEEKRYALQEVVIEAKSSVQRINESAYNAIALDATVQHNSTANLSNMLNKVSGVRIRETGGVGSDMQVMLDGFSGKHVKVFIDGVPQEGVGGAFGLHNIPVNYAERIEVYKGVVPVEFGTDAIGGVINVVTKKGFNKKWHLDASYSYGSFNTHKSYLNFGQTFNNGLTYEVNAFQNYSDNNYWVDTPVTEFLDNGGSLTNKNKPEHVQRFHDTYHNETVISKIGLVDKPWADRLLFGLTYSHVYAEQQNGVLQDIVFGGKYRKGHSLMPSFEYSKRNLLIKGLDVTATANYNKNISHNVDTTAYEYNWRGEKRLRRNGIRGEHIYQHTRSDDKNWSGTFTARYRVKDIHSFTLNSVFNSFTRSNRSMLVPDAQPEAIGRETQKSISGLSYQLMPSEVWNASVFCKYYYQHVSGPVAVNSAQDQFERMTKNVNTAGYGMAGTYFVMPNLQAKLSYEKVYRLPNNTEMFGDNDLESGDLAIKPENSDNINVNISYSESFGMHGVYVEGGFIYRDIKDYIQRNITGLSGGKYGAAYVNHGKVLTKGYTLTARYNLSNWMSAGGNFTSINTRDNVKKSLNSDAPNMAYKSRMPNVPYLFANSDATFYWHNLGKKGNVLSFTYDNFYMKRFPLYSEAFGSSESKSYVPTQFSHNIAISYSVSDGKYNVSFECQNIADEKLYDNFSLQKAGRAFYGKLRVSL